jgi:8-oxo-dGTP pyrophosphatase MutT (NUDIX family)
MITEKGTGMARPMSEILEELTAVVGRSHEDSKLSQDMRFCPSCGKETLDPSREMGFICRNDGYSGVRALTFRKNARFKIEDGLLYHFSVGAAVFCQFREEADERVLLLRRATHPVGAFSIPSGHWDVDDENPLEAVKREVEEEAGVDCASSWELISEPNELVEEGCRRACDHHYWHFYRCLVAPDVAQLRLRVDRRRHVYRRVRHDWVGAGFTGSAWSISPRQTSGAFLGENSPARNRSHTPGVIRPSNLRLQPTALGGIREAPRLKRNVRRFL